MPEIIPESALNTHVGVLGRTGSGKTFTARGLVERLLDQHRHVVIIDPTGAWWGLRSHYAVPIFGGDHGDIAITEDSGEVVARTILDNSTSAIVDLSLLARQSGAAMRRFMRAFVARLKDKPNGAIWLVIDEADEFLPQTIPGGMEGLFGDLKWLVRRGRVAGWRVMMITQRPQDIAKSVLTQIGTLVAHRLSAPQDRKAIEEWVKGHADPDAAKQVLSTLAGLQTGEAWVWWPDGDVLTRGMMPAIKSFDSSATPDAGTGEIVQPPLTAIDMSAIRATLEAGKSDSQKQSVTKSDNIRLLHRLYLQGRPLLIDRAGLRVRPISRGDAMAEEQLVEELARAMWNTPNAISANHPEMTFGSGVVFAKAILPIIHRLTAEEGKAELVEAAEALLHAVCGETGFAAAVRADSGVAYPWPALDIAEADLRAALARVRGEG